MSATSGSATVDVSHNLCRLLTFVRLLGTFFVALNCLVLLKSGKYRYVYIVYIKMVMEPQPITRPMPNIYTWYLFLANRTFFHRSISSLINFKTFIMCTDLRFFLQMLRLPIIPLILINV